MKSKLGRSLLWLGLALAGWLPAQAYVQSSHQSTWPPGSIPMQIKLGYGATSERSNFSVSAQQAMQTWNSYLGVVQFAPQIVGTGGQVNGINDIYFAADYEGTSLGNGVLAVTFTFQQGNITQINQIFETDIVFNTLYQWDSYSGNLRSNEDLHRVALHELGHVLGLSHPDENGQSVEALMNAYVSNLDHLVSDDIAGGQSLYRAPGNTFPPSNDNFAQAIAISLSSGTTQVLGNSYYATKESGEPDHDPGSGVGGASVWWKWTAPNNGGMTVDTAHSNFDTLLGVYTGSAVNALTTIGANDDKDPGVLRYSMVTFTAAAGTTYYFAVDGWNAESGPIKVNLNFTPEVANSAPTIITHPASASVPEAQTVQFSVSAQGNPIPNYQWQLLPAASGVWTDLSEGGNYSSVTNSTLSVDGVSLSMNGDRFRCVVTNSFGTVTTNPATLSVLALPVIVTHPQSQITTLGSDVSFTVVATSDTSLSYQWRKEGNNLSNGEGISGATDATLTLSDMLASDAGKYTVVLTNAAGSVTSNLATLTINFPPSISSRPLSRMLTVGQSATFAVTATDQDTITYQWKRNGAIIAGATTSTLSLSNVTLDDRGWYEVIVSNTNAPAMSVFHVEVALAHGAVRAWGDNYYGQASVPEYLGDVAQVDTSLFNSIALRKDGTVVTWGGDGFGSTVPQAPNGLSNVVAVRTGGVNLYALKDDGTIIGWGNAPSIPSGLNQIVAIDVEAQNVIALKADGTVVTWGYNLSGSANVPARLRDVVAISAGLNFDLALRNDGTVSAWGANGSGQSTVPQNLTGVIAVSAGQNHSIALKADGTMTGWGDNTYGVSSPPAELNNVIQIAGGRLALKSDGTLENWSDPSSLPQDLTSVSSIAANVYTNYLAIVPEIAPSLTSQPANQTRNVGDLVTFSITATGLPLRYQWAKDGVNLVNGGNIAGATSATLTISNVQPSDVGSYSVIVSNDIGNEQSHGATLSINGPAITTRPLSKLVSVGQSVSFTAAATGYGTPTYQWKHNGEIIPGATDATLTLTNTIAFDRGRYEVIVSDVGGSATSVFYLNIAVPDATVVGWGNNGYGQINPPANLTNIAAIAAGQVHSLAVRGDGTVVGWGGDPALITIPSGLDNVVSVSAGGGTSMALKSDGTAVAWSSAGVITLPSDWSDLVAIAVGGFYNGALALKADGTVVSLGNIILPTGLSNVVAITAGWSHYLALKADGTVVQITPFPSGSQTPAPEPLNDVIDIAAGNSFNVALRADGTVVQWGYTQGLVPVDLSNVTGIASGSGHSMALKGDGRVTAWGYNGDGRTTVPTSLANVLEVKGGQAFSLALSMTASGLPAITTHPQSQIANAGQSLNFTVIAAGPGPLIYQWRRNGVILHDGENFSGTASATLTINNLQMADAGSYTVVVSNTTGSVASSAKLKVVDFPVITSRPLSSMSSVAQPATFTIEASGTDLTYKWKHNGQIIVGATGDTLSIPSVTLADRGRYEIIVTSGSGETSMSVFWFYVRPASSSVVAWGSQTTVPSTVNDVTEVAAGGTNLAVKFDGTVVAWNSGGPVSVPTGLSDVVSVAASGQHNVVLKADGTVYAWGNNDSGQINVPVGLNNVVAIATARLTGQTLALKNDGTVVGWGSAIPVPSGLKDVVGISSNSNDCIAVKVDGTVITWGYSGTTKPPSGLTNIVSTAQGSNHGLALKLDGTVSTWGVNSNGVTTIPSGLSNVEVVSGGDRYSMALKSDGSVVAWGNNSIGQTNIPTGLTGVFSIAAGYSHLLAVRAAPEPPVITSQLSNQTVAIGGNITFSIVAKGTPALSYQWRKGGSNLSDGGSISGATSATLTITNVQDENAGSYDVVVTNGAGSVTSDAATLTVNKLAQTITFPALADRAYTTSPITLTATATSGLTVGFAVQSGPATLNGNELTLTGTGAVTVRASQPGNNNYLAASNVDRSFTVGGNLQSWLSGYFSESELLDSNVSGPTADPDGDSLSNLLEYALGLDPKSTDTTGLPEMSTTSTDWVYTYTRPASRADLTYEVEASTSLSSWSTAGVTHTLVSSSGGTETWTAKVALSSATNLYFRLKITQN